MNLSATVILGVRDNLPGLLRSLKSLQAQTVTDWDCIVIDDGSSVEVTDGVASLGDPRIRVLRQAPAGLTAALDRGVRAAGGDVIFRLDADDEASPDRLHRQLAHLRERADVVAVGTGIALISEAGKLIKQYEYPSSHEALVGQLNELLTPLPHSSLAVRREALDRAGGYRLAFGKAQDYDLLLRLSGVGHLSSIPEPCVRLVASSYSLTSDTAGGEQFQFCVLAYVSKRIRSRLGSDPIDARAAAFLSAFESWYRKSSYPSLFRSRLSRRNARIASAAGRRISAIKDLGLSVVEDPAWPLRPNGLGRIAAEADAWADAWAEEQA